MLGKCNDSFKYVTKHRRVARRHKIIFSNEIEQKQSILCLKCKSRNFNFLFIEVYYCIKPHCNRG